MPMQNTAYSSEIEDTPLQFDQVQTYDLDSADLFESKPAPEPGRSAAHTHDEVEDKVKRAEEQLVALQQKRQALEQQKQELQKLSDRRRVFKEGRDKVVKILTNALPELREEAEDAQRQSEFLHQMRGIFNQHLDVLKTVKPDDWEETDIEEELDRGTAALDEAKAEIKRFEERLTDTPAAWPQPPQRLNGVEFARLMKMGFAFALPFMVFASLALVMTYLVVNQ